jgi:hypothetical protein
MRRLSALCYNLLNLFLFVCVVHRSTHIAGDGPGGFGEMICLAMLVNLVLLACIVGLLCTLNRIRTIATLLLAGMPAPAIYDACNNAVGHCLNWRLFFAHPPVQIL